MQEIEYYDAELDMSSYLIDGEWYWDEPTLVNGQYQDAVIYRVDNEYHREDGPAIEYADGKEYWMLEGVIHREGGPAVSRGSDGTKKWVYHGDYHRLDGPAIEWGNGSGKEWYKYGARHRIDGPAVVDANARDNEWYLNDEQFTRVGFHIALVGILFSSFIDGIISVLFGEMK